MKHAGPAEVARAFPRIGVASFGGPAAQIALMHRELIERRGRLVGAEYLRALSFCMLLPGPEAMQLATYVGWRRAGVAGGLFLAPGAAVVQVLGAGWLILGRRMDIIPVLGLTAAASLALAFARG